MGDWMRSAQRAAAMEFGRRNYRTFAAWEVTKRTVPALAVGATFGGLCWLGWKGWHLLTAAPSPDFGWVSAALPWVVLTVVVAAAAAGLVWAGRRYMWLWDVFLPLEHGAAVAVAACVAVAVGAGGVVWWAVF